MLNELNNKIETLEEKIDKMSSNGLGQYLLSTGTVPIDGVVVRLCESKIY